MVSSVLYLLVNLLYGLSMMFSACSCLGCQRCVGQALVWVVSDVENFHFKSLNYFAKFLLASLKGEYDPHPVVLTASHQVSYGLHSISDVNVIRNLIMKSEVFPSIIDVGHGPLDQNPVFVLSLVSRFHKFHDYIEEQHLTFHMKEELSSSIDEVKHSHLEIFLYLRSILGTASK
ncbi:hypothetical protein J6590_070662 [Homalodisca vitripennis]|nr:hypothetical protein J6590_070662 [Homalodisca vitripennis]